MRVALLISGYLRSFKINIPNIKTKILDKFDKVDIYIHITKNESTQDKYFNLNHELEDLKWLEEILSPTCLIYEDNYYFSKNKKKNNLYNHWIKFYKLNELRKINEIKFKYDLIIKYRPDLNMISENVFPDIIENNLVYIPSKSLIDKSKLENSGDDHLCDIFAFGDGESMNKYFDIYHNLDSLTQKNGNTPENILFNYFVSSNIPKKLVDMEYNVILSLCNVFAIAGDSGSGKTTLGNILKTYFSNSFMLECDRYHKWERGDDNWKKFTHLNPEANFITKMSDDIFDLKIGKSIYHVNYDHSTGKFTEKQEIETSDNLIVCGLHSLLGKNDGVYDLKIFVDTDTKLKQLWKIKRDVLERGYTKEKVLEQISLRKDDYYKYVLPQRDLSDLIINFTTEDQIDLNYPEILPNVILNLFIHKKYSLLEIISYFSARNIPFKIDSSDKNHNKVTFLQYYSINDDDRFNLGNYYDYVVIVILFLGKKIA
jgi:uridine kinase